MIYLDPGKAKDCALACFEANELIWLGWCDGVALRTESGLLTRCNLAGILWEKPEIYTKRKSKGNPNQLIDLAIAGATAVTYLRMGWGIDPAKVRSITPHNWKGSIAKPPHHLRLWGVLSPAERALFPANTEAYILAGAQAYAAGVNPNYAAQCVDLLDAAALGCYDLGRLPGPLAGKVQALRAARNPNRRPRRGKNS